MFDLNKILNGVIQDVTTTIQDRLTDDLTEKDKLFIRNQIEQAMTSPVRNRQMIDNLTDGIYDQLVEAAFRESTLLQPEGGSKNGGGNK